MSADLRILTMINDVSYFVEKGYALPVGAISYIPGGQGIGHGLRMAKEAIEEFGLHNKRKLVGPLASTAATTGLTMAGSAVAGVVTTGVVPNPITTPLAIGVGVGVVAMAASMAGVHGYNRHKYHETRRGLEEAFDSNHFDDDDNVSEDNVTRLASLVRNGELSELARSFEKVRDAQRSYQLSDKKTYSCRQLAERLHQLYYWGKRLERLRGDSGDHRQRNVTKFLNLVPRKLFREAQAALTLNGQAVVQKAASVTTARPTNQLHPDDGLLTWGDWWQNQPAGANQVSNRILANAIEAGRRAGDPKRLSQRWGAALARINAATQGHPVVGGKGSLPSKVPVGTALQGAFVTRNPKVALGGDVAVGAKAAMAKYPTSLIIKELVTAATFSASNFTGAIGHALSNPASWGIGAAALPFAVIAGAMGGLCAEALNARMNMGDIFNPDYDPAKKVWLVRSVLEFGGINSIMSLRSKIGATIAGLDQARGQLATVSPAQTEGALTRMCASLYQLHVDLIKVAVQVLFWEIMVRTVEIHGNTSAAAYSRDSRDCIWYLEQDLADGVLHLNCNTICYADNGHGQPIKRLDGVH